ncbi:MAG TPA: hypothetical protein VI981_00710 [Candidatus Paceibacterota bacterium]
MNYESEVLDRPPVAEDEVVRALQDDGIENADAKELLMQLAEQYQREADTEDTSLANISAALKLAKIYARAGMADDALRSLEGLREAAFHEREASNVRFTEISRVIDDIESGGVWKA